MIQRVKTYYRRFCKLIPDLPWWNLLFNKVQRRVKSGAGCSIRAPRTLNDVILNSKVYGRDQRYTILANKFYANRFVASRIGEEFVPKIYHHYWGVDEICKSSMVDLDQFVVKSTHDSSGALLVESMASVPVIDAKNTMGFATGFVEDVDRSVCENNFLKIKKFLNHNTSRSHFYHTREWQYKDQVPSILLEQLLLYKERPPNDIKVHCRFGEPFLFYCSVDRTGRNYRKLYDRNWRPIAGGWGLKGDEEKFLGDEIEQPNWFSDINDICSALARDIPYVRLDFYDLGCRPVFGEYTFHHGSGWEVIWPEAFSREIVKNWKL